MTTDHERAEAVRTVAAVLHGRLAPTLDADHVAALAVDALHAAGWRPIPRPQPITAPGRRDPATAHRGADRVREAFEQARETKTRGEQP